MRVIFNAFFVRVMLIKCGCHPLNAGEFTCMIIYLEFALKSFPTFCMLIQVVLHEVLLRIRRSFMVIYMTFSWVNAS